MRCSVLIWFIILSFFAHLNGLDASARSPSPEANTAKRAEHHQRHAFNANAPHAPRPGNSHHHPTRNRASRNATRSALTKHTRVPNGAPQLCNAHPQPTNGQNRHLRPSGADSGSIVTNYATNLYREETRARGYERGSRRREGELAEERMGSRIVRARLSWTHGPVQFFVCDLIRATLPETGVTP